MDDVDQILAKHEGGGDDVDAILARHDQRARLMERAAANAARPKEPDPFSPGEFIPGAAKEVGAEALSRVKHLARGVAAIGEYGVHVIAHPLNTVSALWRNDLPEEDARRRQLERGVDDTVTLGYGGQLADHIAQAVGGRTMAESEQQDAAIAPDLRTGGQLVGMGLGGAAKTIGKGAAAASKALLPGAGALKAGGRAVLGYGMAAPAMAGLSAQASGDRAGAALDAATDPGLLVAGMAGMAGGSAGGRVMKSEGAKAAQLIEREGQGARVGLTTPGKGGVFANELKGVPANDRGIGQAAKIGSKNILTKVAKQHQVETSKPYRVMEAAIDASPEANQARDVTPIVTHMQNAAYDLSTAPQTRAALEGELRLLERYRQPERQGGAILVPERQLNGLRRSLMRAARVGQTDAPGEKEAPLRAAAFEAKRMVDQGPYKALNEFYAEGAAKLRTAREQLGLKPKPSADKNTDIKKLKLSLRREVENTSTAGGDSDLEAFRAAHPELVADTNLAKLADARAKLSFHLLPQHGGLIPRMAGAALGPGAALGAMAAGHGAAGVAGGAAIAAMQNASPIAGRLLYPLARQGGVNPLMWAAEQQRRREAEASGAMGGVSK